MTRQEWFNTLTPEVQEQFKFNTNQNESASEDSFFKFWIEQGSRGITSGIGGAFSFGNTPQGFHYWNDIDKEAGQLIKYDNSHE
jgi:hypothetical protein